MKGILCFGAAMLIAVAGPTNRASAVTTAVPTAGIAVTSFVVGAAAATESAIEDTIPKWRRKLIGFTSLLLMAIDPDPATYLFGRTVIEYPESLLEFQQLTWYGAFSDMSTGDTGPIAGPGAVQGSGFFDDVKLFVPQGPNPALNVTGSATGGVLNVSWNAFPGIQAEGASVNIFGAVFKSISPTDLQFEITPAGSPLANFYQNTAAQALVCIPSHELMPRGCGYPDEPIGFRITPLDPALPGDFNGDSSVDAADYVVWRDTMGTPDDYQLWRSHFGMTLPASGSASSVPAAIPEPASLGLLLIGAVIAAGTRQKRRD